MPRNSPPDPSRQLMIKTQVCQRLKKEVTHYRKEVIENEQEWKRIEADPTKDAYDAKRYRDIWEESVRMVPDAERRHQAALKDLFAHIQQHFSDEIATTNETNEWFPIALELLKNEEMDIQGVGSSGALEAEVTNVDDLAEGEAF